MLRLILWISRLTLEVWKFMLTCTDLSGAIQTWQGNVATLLNQHPRKTLGWKSPEEAIAEEIMAFRSTVAPET